LDEIFVIERKDIAQLFGTLMLFESVSVLLNQMRKPINPATHRPQQHILVDFTHDLESHYPQNRPIVLNPKISNNFADDNQKRLQAPVVGVSAWTIKKLAHSLLSKIASGCAGARDPLQIVSKRDLNADRQARTAPGVAN
jgi:hypothetical protein